ncbi:Myb-like DNA-binding domain protein, partial [Modicella reniformis]
RWSERERTNLKAGVISENKRILFEALSEAGDVDGIQSLNSAPDMDMMVNTKGLDWNRISQRFVDTRTAKECLIQWTGIDHPGISKADWSNIEIANLDELVKKYQERNWIQIALDLDTNRTSAQCFRKYMSRKATRTVSKLPWSDQEDAILKEAVQMIGEKNWQQISYCFDNRTAAQCMHRWSKSINPSIRRGRWTEEEDGALRISATTFGESHWTKVQHHILGRTDVQCRERYMNVLSPKVKSGPWTDEENIRLVELVEVDGMKKWSDVALNMEGRTDNQCARRYRMICKEEETGRLYKSNRRRKGRTTLAQLSTPDKQQPKQQPEASSPVSQKREKGKNHSRNKQEVRVEWLREKKLRVDYDAFAWRYRRIYDLWDERWGKFVDPIEKVFNLGVPPTTPLQGASEDEVSISNPIMPEPASVLRPGRIRPVPPCSATMNAFSRNITQGEYLDGRFRLRNVINNGSVVTNSLTTTPLSSEEMNRPEYKELADRFDAVFLWPMMMGMLHMGAARELIQTPPDVLLGNGTPSQQQPSAPAVPSTEESAPAVPSTEESAQSTPQPATAMIETATSSAKASSSRGKRKPKQTEASDPSSAPAKRQKRKTPAA